MRLCVRVPEGWPKRKILIDPITKKRYYPEHIDGDVFFDVDVQYGRNLLDKTPDTFELVKGAPPVKKDGPVDYHKMKYQELQKFYSETLGIASVGKKAGDMVSDLDEHFAEKGNGNKADNPAKN